MTCSSNDRPNTSKFHYNPAFSDSFSDSPHLYPHSPPLKLLNDHSPRVKLYFAKQIAYRVATGLGASGEVGQPQTRARGLFLVRMSDVSRARSTGKVSNQPILLLRSHCTPGMISSVTMGQLVFFPNPVHGLLEV